MSIQWTHSNGETVDYVDIQALADALGTKYSIAWNLYHTRGCRSDMDIADSVPMPPRGDKQEDAREFLPKPSRSKLSPEERREKRNASSREYYKRTYVPNPRKLLSPEEKKERAKVYRRSYYQRKLARPKQVLTDAQKQERKQEANKRYYEKLRPEKTKPTKPKTLAKAAPVGLKVDSNKPIVKQYSKEEYLEMLEAERKTARDWRETNEPIKRLVGLDEQSK
jgi:hypothetical protein